jgi:nicotinamidase-related amidase
MNPHKTALILIGYQNDYFASDGILNGVIEASAKATHALENTVNLVAALADQPVLKITTPIIFSENYEEIVEPVGILKTIKEVGAFNATSSGSETVPELEPFQDKILEVPGKCGFNAFINTGLDDLLKQHEITDVVLAGAVTSICIDSTGRFAHEQGYRVSMLSDCTSARTTFEQDFYFENIFPIYANTISSQQLLESFAVAV